VFVRVCRACLSNIVRLNWMPPICRHARFVVVIINGFCGDLFVFIATFFSNRLPLVAHHFEKGSSHANNLFISFFNLLI
jgi:hypothetical protein